MFLLYRQLISYLLDLKFSLFRFFERLKFTADSEALSAPQQYNADISSARRDALQNAGMQWLYVQLRRTPWWLKGHLALGEHALTSNDIGVAYACAQAALKLKPSSNAARFLLARCYLRKGLAAEAHTLLQELHGLQPRNHYYLEELGACYLAQGNHEQAAKALSSIPEGAISHAARVALEYSRSQIK